MAEASPAKDVRQEISRLLRSCCNVRETGCAQVSRLRRVALCFSRPASLVSRVEFFTHERSHSSSAVCALDSCREHRLPRLRHASTIRLWIDGSSFGLFALHIKATVSCSDSTTRFVGGRCHLDRIHCTYCVGHPVGIQQGIGRVVRPFGTSCCFCIGALDLANSVGYLQVPREALSSIKTHRANERGKF